MKRLIKKSDIFAPDDSYKNNVDQIENVEENPDSLDGLVKLDELSEADMRHERCPVCKFNPLKRHDGFKQCPRCESVYKMLDGQGYIVSK